MPANRSVDLSALTEIDGGLKQPVEGGVATCPYCLGTSFDENETAQRFVGDDQQMIMRCDPTTGCGNYSVRYRDRKQFPTDVPDSPSGAPYKLG